MWLWSDFPDFAAWLGREEDLTIPYDGLCFIRSIQKALCSDYGLDWLLENIKCDIMCEVTKNAKKYMVFHENEEYKVITFTHDYLTNGQFTQSVVDVVIPATAYALKVNLYIYCKKGANILLIPNMSPGSNLDVYLRYDHQGGEYHGADHYTPLLLKNPGSTALAQSIVSKNTPVQSVATTCSPSCTSSIVQARHAPGVNVSALCSSATSSSVSSPPGVAVPNVPSVHSQIPVHCTFSSANVSSVAGNTFDKSSSQSLDCENITTDDDTTSGKKTVNIEMRENQKNSGQRQEDDRNDDEAIVSDIVNGCAEDEEGYYFDEYGMGLTGSSLKVAPSERPNIPIVSTAEELMSFEAFAEIERDGPFQPSQEDSDIEPEPPLSQSTSQLTNSASSDEEINKIPEKQRKTSRLKKRKWSKNKMPYAKCLNMEVEMLDSIPWDVDGDHRFRVFCDVDNWVDKAKDGRWYKLNSSSRKGLNGFHKMGTCQGSILCQNIGCPKLQSEGVINSNPNDFQLEYGCYICKSCSYYAVQIHCGCKKLVEYDIDAKELTVWYEGDHNCTPKPDMNAMKNFFNALPLKSSLRLTHTELRNDCMRYFMSTGQYDKAMEVALMLNNPQLIERMRFIQPGANISNYAEDLAVTFSCIDDIKKEMDKFDKYFIWAYNCGKTNGGDTYIYLKHRNTIWRQL